MKATPLGWEGAAAADERMNKTRFSSLLNAHIVAASREPQALHGSRERHKVACLDRMPREGGRLVRRGEAGGQEMKEEEEESGRKRL